MNESADELTTAATTTLSSYENTTTYDIHNNGACGFFNHESIAPYRFWCDGVLVSSVAFVGFTGNLLALLVLSRPKLRDVFHQLLFALACFDILYIICGGVNYTFRAFMAESDIYTYLFPYFLYPMTHVSMAGTIFMTLAISIERYLGLCHPMLPPHSRKAWFYIVPVVVVSFAINVPKFLEVELEISTDDDGNSVPAYRSTNLRFDETYIRAYIMWTRLFSTAVIPVTLLLYLNTCIVIDLCNSKVQRFGSARRQRREINLCFILLAIVIVFFLCHAARIILDVYEFTNVEKVITCKPWIPEFWAQALSYIAHLTMIINSSVNFIVYCLVGHTFRRELCRTLGCRPYFSVPGGADEFSRRPSTQRFECANGNGKAVGVTSSTPASRMNSYVLVASVIEENDSRPAAVINVETVPEESEEVKFCSS